MDFGFYLTFVPMMDEWGERGGGHVGYLPAMALCLLIYIPRRFWVRLEWCD